MSALAPTGPGRKACRRQGGAPRRWPALSINLLAAVGPSSEGGGRLPHEAPARRRGPEGRAPPRLGKCSRAGTLIVPPTPWNFSAWGRAGAQTQPACARPRASWRGGPERRARLGVCSESRCSNGTSRDLRCLGSNVYVLVPKGWVSVIRLAAR